MASAAAAPPLPVPIEQAKAYLRLTGSDEDALLAGLLRTASELCESFTRTALIEREVEEAVAATPAWTRLRLAPVRAILSLTTLDGPGEGALLAPGDHAIDIDASGDGWVRILRSGGSARVAVRYRAGQAKDWNSVPEPLRQGIVRLAAHLYTHRDDESGGAPPAAVTALWLPYRRLRLS